MTETVKKVIALTENYLRQLNEHIEEYEGEEKLTESFNLDDFCLKFANAAQEISRTTARIIMAFTKPHYPSIKQTQEFMNNIESSASSLVSLYHAFPRDLGCYFEFSIFKLAWDILKSLLKFTQTLKSKNSKGSREKFEAAGNVFSACEEVKDMPINNLTSVLTFLHSEELLLVDSLQEIVKEVLRDFSAQRFGKEIDNTKVWTNEDRGLLPASIELVKAARSCMKKIVNSVNKNGNCDSLTNIAELDIVANVGKDLSPLVAMFVYATYPPMNRKRVKKAAQEVANMIRVLLNKVKDLHFIKEQDQIWLNKLLKAVDHDNNKLYPLLSPESSEESDDEPYDETEDVLDDEPEEELDDEPDDERDDERDDEVEYESGDVYDVESNGEIDYESDYEYDAEPDG